MALFFSFLHFFLDPSNNASLCLSIFKMDNKNMQTAQLVTEDH